MKRFAAMFAVITAIICILSSCDFKLSEEDIKRKVNNVSRVLAGEDIRNETTAENDTLENTIQTTEFSTIKISLATEVSEETTATAESLATEIPPPKPVDFTTIVSAPSPVATAPAATAPAPAATTPAQQQISTSTNNYYYNNLNNNLKYVYDVMKDCALNFKDTAHFSTYQPTTEELFEVYYNMFFNEPYLYHTEDALQYMGDPITDVYYSYKEGAAEFNNKKAAVEQKATQILSGIPAGASDYDKSLYIYTYLINNCTYTLNGNDVKNVYGALINGKAQCMGYSFAYMYLARKAGLEVSPASGDAGGPHMWDYVKIDGNWYNIDVTWGDGGEQNGENMPIYEYLHFIDNEGDFRVADSYIIARPTCSDTNTASFFYKNGYLATDGASANEIVKKQIINCNKNGEKKYTIYLQCSTRELYNNEYISMIDNQYLCQLFIDCYKANSITSYPETMRYIKMDDFKSIIIVLE